MSPASGAGRPASTQSLREKFLHPFRRSEQSQDNGSGSEASQVDPPVGLGFDSASLARGPSTPLLSGEDIEREKYQIVDTLNPNVRNPEDVSERLDKVNEIFENWENSDYPQLAATARYRNNSAITAQALLDGATAFLSVSGRANVQSETGWNKKSKFADTALKAGAAVTSSIPIPFAPAAFKAASEALSAYTKIYRFDKINKALMQALKEKEREPFRESFSLALALIKMGTLGNEEHRLSQPRDNKGKKTIKKDPEQRIKEIREREEESAGKDTSNAILALVFGKVFQNWEKVSYDKILDKLQKTPNEKKVELALDRLCKKQKIDFDERMVACRPPRNEELRALRRSISVGRFNQNPEDEAVPARAPAGSYSREETQSIADDKAKAESAYQRVLRKIEQKDEAKAIHEDLVQKADEISKWHPLDKIKANDAANEAGERYRRKKKELKQAEAAYERLLDEAYGERSQDTTPALGIGTRPSGSGSTHTPTYAQPVAPVNQPSGANRTGWGNVIVSPELQRARDMTGNPIPYRVQAGASNQVPLRMSTGHPLGGATWQAAAAPAPRENLVYLEPESDEELDPTPSPTRRRRRDDAVHPSGSGSRPGPPTRPGDDEAASALAEAKGLYDTGDALSGRRKLAEAKAHLDAGDSLGGRRDWNKAIEVYDEVVKHFGKANELKLRVQAAEALNSKGTALYALNKWSIGAYDEVDRRFGKATELKLREQVAKALYEKGVALDAHHDWSEAIEVFDEVDRRFGKATELKLREQVAKALHRKAVTFVVEPRGGWNKAIEAHDEVVKRFGKAIEPELCVQVAKSLHSKGIALRKLNDWNKAIEVYDEVDRRFGKATEPELRHLVADALRSKSNALRVLNGTFDDLNSRFGMATELKLREQGAKVLRKNGVALVGDNNSLAFEAFDVALVGHNDWDKAIEAFDEMARHFGGENEPAMREQVAKAIYYKSVVLRKLAEAAENARSA